MTRCMCWCLERRNMRTSLARLCVPAACVVVFAACGEYRTTSPTPVSPPGASATMPPPARSFPPLSGPSRTFVFERELRYPVSAYTRLSRFVLYDNGAFLLQYPTLNVVGGGYRGEYRAVAGRLVFDWEGWSAAGPWAATATLAGDVLTVEYNDIMTFTDFEDAIYVLAP